MWGKQKEPMVFGSLQEYEEFAAKIELQEQLLLQDHPYNTVENFVRFYDSYQCERNTRTVEEFFHRYQPPITPAHYTCVGLGMELIWRISKLEYIYPGLTAKFYLSSCEEMIDDIDGYISNSPPDDTTCEKEHVLVTLRIVVAGRTGIMLLDPGYHVARAVTVMKDNMYPHTGWFVQSETRRVKREYMYRMEDISCHYITWHVRETRQGRVKEEQCLIYIHQEFLTAVDSAERRNLAYPFKTLLMRDMKGQLIAGVYFSLKRAATASFTVFYHQWEKRKEQKIPVSYFMAGIEIFAYEEAMLVCGNQLQFPQNRLKDVLVKVANIIRDESFLRDIEDFNEKINLISADN